LYIWIALSSYRMILIYSKAFWFYCYNSYSLASIFLLLSFNSLSFYRSLASSTPKTFIIYFFRFIFYNSVLTLKRSYSSIYSYFMIFYAIYSLAMIRSALTGLTSLCSPKRNSFFWPYLLSSISSDEKRITVSKRSYWYYFWDNSWTLLMTGSSTKTSVAGTNSFSSNTGLSTIISSWKIGCSITTISS